MQYKLQELLPGLKYPVIMAPMFLVSTTEMLIEATSCGIAAAIPALNYRNLQELDIALLQLKQQCKGPFGINLIVNKSNPYWKKHLELCCKHKIDFIITSLGSPKEVIEKAHKYGIKVFCDVVDLSFALKSEQLGADALIAVNNQAGGHAGNLTPEALIPLLKQHCKIPIIAAGGAGDATSVANLFSLGADGISVGTAFIATHESPVSDEYKKACIQYSDKDIVFTDRLSGTPCTVINTSYVKQTGTKQNALESFLSKNKRIKKWIKAFTFLKGMNVLKKAAFENTYKKMWCAGPSIKYVTKIRSIKEVVDALVAGIN